MKICFAFSHFEMGGVEKSIRNVAGQLQNKHNDIFLWATDGRESFFDMGFPIDGADSFPHYRLVSKFKKSADVLRNREIDPNKYQNLKIDEISKYIIDKSIDLVVMNDANLIAMIVPLRLRFPHLKFISWIHVELPEMFKQVSRAFFLGTYIKGLRQSNVVVTLTTSDFQVATAIGATPIKIYNGISLPKVGEIRNEENTFPHQIAFTARFDEIKGINDMLWVASHLPNGWKIDVAGFRKDDLDEEQLRIIQSSEHKIVFNGKITGHKLQQHYQNSSFVLSTSYVEGLSLALIEGMSYGLIPISYAHFGAKEILNDSLRNGMVPIGDKVRALSIINQYIENQSDGLELMLDSLKRSESFSVEHMGDQWQALLRRLVAPSK